MANLSDANYYDIDYVVGVNEQLRKNANAPWVKRIVDMRRTGVPAVTNADGSRSTHSMAYADVGDGQSAVYPTVRRDSTGKAQRLSPRAAFEKVRQLRDALIMPEAEAKAFTRGGYKTTNPKEWD